MIFSYKFSREPNTKITEKMDFHPLQVSPLPRKGQDLQEYINVVPEAYVAVEDHLENPNFQLHVREIIKRKVEDAEENLKPFAICFLKIASRMGDDTFLVHRFLMEPKLGTCIRKILQTELQIPRGLKWPVQDVSSDVGLTMLRPSKIPASLLLDAHPKMSPLLQPSQSTGAIPSSGSILQVINKRTAIVCWENELANNQSTKWDISGRWTSMPGGTRGTIHRGGGDELRGIKARLSTT